MRRRVTRKNKFDTSDGMVKLRGQRSRIVKKTTLGTNGNIDKTECCAEKSRL